MISLECSDLRDRLHDTNPIKKNWGKLLIAELIILTVGLALLVVGLIAGLTPEHSVTSFQLLVAGGAALSFVFVIEMGSLAAHYTRQAGYWTPGRQ